MFSTDQYQPSGSSPEPIAIIGSGCRFPGGVSSTSKLWELLRDSRDVQTRIPIARFDVDGFYMKDGDVHGTTKTDRAYLLEEDIRHFDNHFFGIRAEEAESMDPQQRILLEVVYEGLESAGYTIQRLQGSLTAVYVGQLNGDYYDVVTRDVDDAPKYTATGTSRSLMSNRISYFFDWKGPSWTIDTACSSSLIAVHHAVQSLRSGEATLAIAAGVNLILGPEQFIFESQLGMLSPTGRSRMWDASADGYARGDGVAAVMLKRLSRAIADGDNIECIIRETGANQDGRSMGITMPSAEAQMALIRSTYHRCGLDPTTKEGRCQYFEAHGTGTPAGDPVEARAVQSVFFPKGASIIGDSLLVGSIKTVIGHTEGTAGLAGLLKASLALQNGEIPANMHFEKLHPDVAPYAAQHLRVPSTTQKWPDLPNGVPRRASVNSFGFGGTNGHCILESWPQRDSGSLDSEAEHVQSICGPVVLSAVSPNSLASSIAALSGMLTENSLSSEELSDLVWTLQTKRSEFPFKASFSAASQEELVQDLNQWSEGGIASIAPAAATRPSHSVASFPILGIFTGQGAQWPRMGATLLKSSEQFRATIKSLDDSLALLPNPPSWSIRGELEATGDNSRIAEAEISQPACTAVQIALVDLLASAGIQLYKVVGHSSGEISAAYAAGYVTARDAIRIAYYRGSCLRHASRKGRMLAADLTAEDADEFCSQPQFSGKIALAASNSSSSVTLSGEADAIFEAQKVLEQRRGVFARVLQVDRAYHSPHMEDCASEYRTCLQRCNIQASGGSGTCTWYSSVYPGAAINPESLSAEYWISNMVKPVRFSEALQAALGDKDTISPVVERVVALELGPHPALKRPAMDSAKAAGYQLTYSSMLRRGADDVKSTSEAIGFIWRHFSGTKELRVDFDRFRSAFLGRSSGREPKLFKALPAYCWNHEKAYWRESRISQSFRLRDSPPHPLLGSRLSSEPNERRWRNILKLEELNWLGGHKFQDQTLLPAQAYVCMAIEACITAQDKNESKFSLIELEHLIIHRAITLEENSGGVEVFCTLRHEGEGQQTNRAEFTISSSSDESKDAKGNKQLVFNFKCSALLIHPSSSTVHKSSPLLPPRTKHQMPSTSLSVSQVYSSVEKTGLQYSGDFRAEATEQSGKVGIVHFTRPRVRRLLIHPAMLDVASHGIFAALYKNESGLSLKSAYLPKTIERIRVDARRLRAVAMSTTGVGDKLLADCHLRQTSRADLTCDVEIFNAEGELPEVQIEGLRCIAFGNSSSEKDDRVIFSSTIWKRQIRSGLQLPEAILGSFDILKHRQITEEESRVVYFYLRKMRREVSVESMKTSSPHLVKFWNWAVHHILPQIESRHHRRVKTDEWAYDSHEDILALLKTYPKSIELKVLVTLGESLGDIVLDRVPSLEILMQDQILTRYYQEGVTLKRASEFAAVAVAQIIHQHPQMNIIEVGGGTGGATSVIMPRTNGKFTSYKFTDISAGFLEDARRQFEEYKNMEYGVLDISRDPEDQGYISGSYDMIVASNVLHATPNLYSTLCHCRKLLKPGGYLVMIENTASDALNTEFIFGTFSGWWLGSDDGRVYSPLISESAWDSRLVDSGFSGLDAVTRDIEDSPDTYIYSIMVSQAVDDRVKSLRNPLSAPLLQKPLFLPEIAVIGAQKSMISEILVPNLCEVLKKNAASVIRGYGLDDPALDRISSNTAVICLSELDHPLFPHMTRPKLAMLQKILCQSSHVLWFTQGSRNGDPYANMVLGIARCVMLEQPGRPIQFVDIDTQSKSVPDVKLIASTLLRLAYMGRPDFEENLLWTLESEMAMDAEGRELLPRIIPNRSQNDRLNAEQRPMVRKMKMPSEFSGISLVRLPSGHNELVHRPEVALPGDGLVEITVLSSSVSALTLNDIYGSFYLVQGYEKKSGRHVVALSSQNANQVSVCGNRVWPWQRKADRHQLQDLLQYILAESLVRKSDGKPIWLHGAEENFGIILSRMARDKVFSSTSNIDLQKPGQIFIHPHITARNLKTISPVDINLYACFRGADIQSEKLETLIKKMLGKSTVVAEFPSLVNNQLTIALSYSTSHLYKTITGFVRSFKGFGKVPGSSSRFLTLEHMLSTGTPAVSSHSPFDIIEWPSSSQPTNIPATISRIDATYILSPDRTYFMAGLTGSVGLSLCNWMADYGAKYFALSSRNPSIKSEALAQLNRKGANIRVFHFDLADRRSMEAARDALSAPDSGFPPIGGIVNGAMVMNDRAFENMSLEDLDVVLQPKVDGSKNLEAVFGQSDDIEFFVFMSSTSSVLGIPGLGNYGAANLYMSTLAQQRRRRGKPATAVDLGVLSEVGYLTRSITQHSSQELAKRYNAPQLSESDLHAVFAEAFLAGRQDLDKFAQLHCGVGFWDIGKRGQEANMPGWFNFPRLSHYLVNESAGAHAEANEANEAPKQDIQSTDGLLNQLAAVSSFPSAMMSILESAMAHKLSQILQVSVVLIDIHASLMTLGIDSLVAIQIRAMLSKELKVEIPALKILAIPSVRELCATILENLPFSQSVALSSTASSDGGANDSMPTRLTSMTASVPGLKSKFDTTPARTTARGRTNSEALQSDCDGEEYINDQGDVVCLRTGRMSHGQSRLYFLHQLLDDKTTYNCAAEGIMRGNFDVSAFRKALYSITSRHEIFRSRFFVDESSGQGTQYVTNTPNITFQLRRAETAPQVKMYSEAERKHIFNIENGDAMRVTVLSKNEAEHYILLVYHHIVMDGMSFSTFLRELELGYTKKQLPSVPQTQSIDLSDKQREACDNETMKRELGFWAATYSNIHTPLPLFPFAKTQHRKSLGTYKSNRFSIKLGYDFAQKVKTKCAQAKATPFHFYLAGLALYLARWLATNDLSIGIVDANRQGDYSTMGYFLNILALRIGVYPDITFDRLLRSVRDSVFGALEHSTTPFDEVLDHLRAERSSKHHPLFQVALNYRTATSSRMNKWNSSDVEWTDLLVARNPFDVYVDVTAIGQEDVWIELGCQSYLYSPSDSQFLARSFTETLKTLLSLSDFDGTKIRDIAIANYSGKQQAAILGQGPIISLQEWPPTLMHRVEAISECHPGHLALRDWQGPELTYEAMMQRIRIIQHALEQNGVEEGSTVATYMASSADTLCAMQAIMRAGATYVPLDRRNPVERLSIMLTNSQPKVLIYHEEDAQTAQELSPKIPHCTLLEFQTLLSEKTERVDISCSRDGIACIIHTSGSTGQPKGVMMTHQNLVTQMMAIHKVQNIGREAVLQQSSLGFDCSLEQIFGALAHGGTLVIVPEHARGDSAAIASIMRAFKITYTVGVPSEYVSLLHWGSQSLKECQDWRIAVTGGEKLTSHHVQLFGALGLSQLKVFNAYGPAEGTISCTRGVVDFLSPEVPHTGQVLPNYSILIVDDNLEPVQVGFCGEICIGGPGVARGYLGLPEETEKRFFKKNELSATPSRFYRTGDVGYIMPDGGLRFISRVQGDTQVKIRGMRIELDEIVDAILLTGGTNIIKNATVSRRENEGQAYLVAFTVFDPSFAGDKILFLKQLQSKLPIPDYMVPSLIIPIDELPRTTNGKQDRQAVDALSVSHNTTFSTSENEHSFTDIEHKVKEVWEDVIPTVLRPIISREVDFFRLGGNSLLLIRLQAVFRSVFSVQIRLSDLFASTSLGSMAEKIQSCMHEERSAVLGNIDWEQELASLLDGLDQALPTNGASKAGDYVPVYEHTTELVVVLTGATGFLGSQLLQLLVADDRVQTIHCIAVRTQPGDQRRLAGYESPKVIEHPGNLTGRYFGLTQTDFQSLASSCDIIIHSGADVNFLKPYASLRRSNVMSTRSLIEMALLSPRIVRFHYISTAAVAGIADESLTTSPLAAMSLASSFPTSLAAENQGYAVSKWVSEALLERFSEQTPDKIDVQIHRPVSLIGESAPETDWTNALVRFSTQLRCAPALKEVIDGQLDMVNVDAAASRMISEILAAQTYAGSESDAATLQGGTINFIHYASQNKVSPSEFATFISTKLGQPTQECDLQQWALRASDIGLSPLLYNFFHELSIGSRRIKLPLVA